MRGGGLTPPADHTAFPFPHSSLALLEMPGHMGGGIAGSSLSLRCRESARQLLPELRWLCLYLVFPAPLLSNFISSFRSGDNFAAYLGSSDLQPYARRVSGKDGLRWGWMVGLGQQYCIFLGIAVAPFPGDQVAFEQFPSSVRDVPEISFNPPTIPLQKLLPSKGGPQGNTLISSQLPTARFWWEQEPTLSWELTPSQAPTAFQGSPLARPVGRQGPSRIPSDRALGPSVLIQNIAVNPFSSRSIFLFFSAGRVGHRSVTLLSEYFSLHLVVTALLLGR